MSTYVEKQPQVEAYQVPTFTVEGKPTPATKVEIGSVKYPAGVDSVGPYIRIGGLPARAGNWVVTHTSGVVEVLTDAAFQAKYEPVVTKSPFTPPTQPPPTFTPPPPPVSTPPEPPPHVN